MLKQGCIFFREGRKGFLMIWEKKMKNWTLKSQLFSYFFILLSKVNENILFPNSANKI